MKRFWQFSVAVLLGVVSLSPVFAQQPLQPAPQRQANANAQLQQNQDQLNRQGVVNEGVNQAQGVNRNPGQGGLAELQQQQRNQQQQQLQADIQSVPGLGARINGAAAMQPDLNAQRAELANVPLENFGLNNGATGNNMQPGYSRHGMDQLLGSGAGFTPANLSPLYGTSSLEEGILTGEARYLQGAGEYNRNTAEALKAREQARALYLQNARTGLKTYFELKEINAKYRAANAPLPLTKETLDRWVQQDQPARLNRREYNVDTGRISWPSLLMTAPFDAERIQLEALFARRTASEFGVASDFYRQVDQETDRMEARLKSYLQHGEKFFSDQEYMVAKNFLASLANEARLAPDLHGLAAN